MKKIVTEDGDVFYFDFTRGRLNEIILNLYKEKSVEVNKKRKIGKKNLFGKDRYESYKSTENTYQKLESYKWSCSWDNKIEDYSLDRVKSAIDICIKNYKMSNKNESDLNNWDGYMGNEGARKKEVMRDQKISDLLKGDTSKLEEFLNKE